MKRKNPSNNLIIKKSKEINNNEIEKENYFDKLRKEIIEITIQSIQRKKYLENEIVLNSNKNK